MLALKRTILATFVSAFILYGCGGGGSSSNDQQTNTPKPNLPSQPDSPKPNQSALEIIDQEIAKKSYLDIFHVGSALNYSTQPTDFAIIRDSNSEIAYQTKGFKWSDFVGYEPDETEMVLTKNKLFKAIDAEKVISHKPGEYVIGSPGADGYQIIHNYNATALDGEKVLSNNFMLHIDIETEKSFYAPGEGIYSKFNQFIKAAQAANQKFPKDAYCAVITQVESKQDVFEFNIDDRSKSYQTLNAWIEEQEDFEMKVTQDKFAGYNVAYAVDPSGLYETEAVVEYQGNVYYAQYSPAEKVDVKAQYERSIKLIKEQLADTKDKELVELLNEMLKLREQAYESLKANKLCTAYNQAAAKSILNALKSIENF